MTWRSDTPFRVLLRYNMYEGTHTPENLRHRAGEVVDAVMEGDPPEQRYFNVQGPVVADMQSGYLDWDDYEVIEEGEYALVHHWIQRWDSPNVHPRSTEMSRVQLAADEVAQILTIMHNAHLRGIEREG